VVEVDTEIVVKNVADADTQGSLLAVVCGQDEAHSSESPSLVSTQRDSEGCPRAGLGNVGV